MGERPTGEMSWKNFSGEPTNNGQDPPNSLGNDYLNPIELNTNRALDFAKQLRTNYAGTLDKSTVEDFGRMYQGQSLSWVPTLPNVSNSETFEDHLNTLSWKDELQKMHTHLQIIAAGLEQVAHDFSRNQDQSGLGNEFLNISNQIAEVLVEMGDNSWLIGKSVERETVPDSFVAQGDSISDRRVRDWVMLQACIEALEYLRRVVVYLKEKSGTA